MANEVQICNIALARLGDEATVASISPPEASAQAEHCARFYPIARDSLLEMHPWNFATKRESLAALAIDPPAPFAYAYALPAGCLRMLRVYGSQAASLPDVSADYVIEQIGAQAVVFCNEAQAIAQFTYRQTNTQLFSPLFVDALGWLLASYLAGPIIKGDAGANVGKACLQQFGAILQMARLSDTKQRHVQVRNNAAWIAAR